MEVLAAEQAKQYFISLDYAKALDIAQKHLPQQPEQKLANLLDVAGCACFMLKRYEPALEFFEKAIERNPENLDYQISRGAVLRELDRSDEAVYTLEELSMKVEDPAVHFNLRMMCSSSSEEESAQTEFISEREAFNKDYDRFGGIVPSFLKNPEARSDFMYEKEREIVERINSGYGDSVDWPGLMRDMEEMIDFRQILRANYGVMLKAENRVLLAKVKQISCLYNTVQHRLKIRQELEQVMAKLVQLFKIARLNQTSMPEVVQCQLGQIHDQIQVRSTRQIDFYLTRQSYEEAVKNLQGVQVHKLECPGVADSAIEMSITQNNILAYVDRQFMRALSVSRRLVSLVEQDEAKGRVLFNFYWLLCLRIVLNSQYGIDLQKYIQFRRVFQFIYAEVEAPDHLKLKQQGELSNFTVDVILKHNQIYGNEKILQETRNMISQQTQVFKSYLSEVDEQYSSVIKQEPYIGILTQAKAVSSQHVQFRREFGLQQDMTALMVENLSALFYQFRNPCPAHDLLLKSFAEMAHGTTQLLNGKDSFLYLWASKPEPRQSFFSKIIKKISR